MNILPQSKQRDDRPHYSYSYQTVPALRIYCHSYGVNSGGICGETSVDLLFAVRVQSPNLKKGSYAQKTLPAKDLSMLTDFIIYDVYS